MTDKLLEELGEYACRRCGEFWGFFPEDYEKVSDYPDTCPLCYMPINEMVRAVYLEEGLSGVIRMLWVRLTTPK